MKEVNQVNFNWHTDEDNQEAFSHYRVDGHKGMKGNCHRIDYHSPAGNGDAHYCDILLRNNEMVRVFNINKLFYVEGE
jgi:hypothetical protein